jgi:prepilin-type N-terminal cleavage/methylation domain-containing protein
MKNKRGFTLIEILSVIIIIGIIMFIAIPAVTRYIFKANKSVYASDVTAFVETVRSEYEEKGYGSLLKDDELMLVPIKNIAFEKGNSKSSPYGEYDFDRSYVLVVPEYNKYSYYATVIDSEKVGLIKVKSSQISEDIIEEDISVNLPLLNEYENPSSVFDFNGRAYKRTDVRTVDDSDSKVYVFKDTGIAGEVKVIQLISHEGPVGMLEYFYELWRFNGEVVTSVAKPLKVGYTFKGYYTGLNGTGTKVVNADGSIVEDIAEELGLYTIAYADYSANPLIFNISNKTITFMKNSQTINISPATNGTGNYVYTEISETNSTGTTNYMNLNGTVITVAASTPVGTYTYVVNARDSVSGSEKNATFTINIIKAESNIVCANRTYNGSAQNMYSSYDGCTPSTNSSVTNATETSFTVLCKGDSNHNDSSCEAIMNPQKCNAPTDVSIATNGVVTWTPSSNCAGMQHQISIANSSWKDSSSGESHLNDIKAATGSRKVSVMVPASGNYTSSDSSDATTTVYSVTLTKETGVTSVSGAGNYISGATVTIDASVSSDYNWVRWTGTPNTTTKNYSSTISSNWSAKATVEKKERTYGLTCTCIQGSTYCNIAEYKTTKSYDVCADADGQCLRDCKGWIDVDGCHKPNNTGGYSRGCRVIK